MKKKEIVCKRNGRCCHIRLPGGVYKKCRYMVRIGTLTSCRIYSKRLGTKIYDDGVTKAYCAMRESVPLNFKDCPYNREEWGELLEVTK